RWTWARSASGDGVRVEPRRYRPRYTLDFAAGVASTAPSAIGGPSGAELYMSDLLGDHLIVFGLSSFQSNGASDLFNNINGSVFYLNQARRLNWGVGAYRVAGTFYESDLIQLYRETSVGAYGI